MVMMSRSIVCNLWGPMTCNDLRKATVWIAILRQILYCETMNGRIGEPIPWPLCFLRTVQPAISADASNKKDIVAEGRLAKSGPREEWRLFMLQVGTRSRSSAGMRFMKQRSMA
ncbi:hypothetical protein CISG_00754 [Coccidioides immitis RMSCC 3703]|uniref:Uncharacterized protein n=1 Tax=Coccidioides immitis RMSCC 3703 TaxID=454286 RepID=A0A0J8QQH6_COCIT|nr:hypothetical protein CISG_00754 [Coccidioides immitis RMSCC 3703]